MSRRAMVSCRAVLLCTISTAPGCGPVHRPERNPSLRRCSRDRWQRLRPRPARGPPPSRRVVCRGRAASRGPRGQRPRFLPSPTAHLLLLPPRPRLSRGWYGTGRQCRGAPGLSWQCLQVSGWPRRWAVRPAQRIPAGPGFPGRAGSGRCRWRGSARGRSGWRVELVGGDPGDVGEGMAEFRADHGIHPGFAGNAESELREGRCDSVRYPAGRIDKSAVQVEDHGHCCLGHRPSFSRVNGCQKLACPNGNIQPPGTPMHPRLVPRMHRGPAWLRPGCRPGRLPCGSPWTLRPVPVFLRRRCGRRRSRRRDPDRRSSRRS